MYFYVFFLYKVFAEFYVGSIWRCSMGRGSSSKECCADRNRKG